jgi:glycosyltransferase involved in cell wall biosynthesis/peptidoglycan/xylan/chitin deacetylase (PgdA/CDA1 family)
MLKQLKQTALRGLKKSGVFSLVHQSKWRQERLLILAYHGISLEDEHQWDPDLFMSPDYFRGRLQMLKKFGCTVLPLEEAIQRLYANDLPKNCVALTFDDGYYDFYQQAHPILQEFNFPATVYLTTFYVHYNRPALNAVCSYMLWKRRDATLNLRDLTGQRETLDLAKQAARAAAHEYLTGFAHEHNLSAEEQDVLAAKLARELKLDYEALCDKRILHLLAPEEVGKLAAAGVDIQMHTHRHCSPLNRRLFYREIEENRDSIQGMTGASPTHFCYPSGVFGNAFLPWLEDLNVFSATTCEPGFASRDSHRLLLPRLVDHTHLSPIEFEGWLTGAAAVFPRRHKIYNPPLKEDFQDQPQAGTQPSSTFSGQTGRGKEEQVVKPRVLQLIGNLQASGGSERQAAQLVRSLRESSQYQVYLACMDPMGGLDKEFHQMGFGEIPTFKITGFYNHTMVIQLTRFVQYLRQHKIDVVQTHDFYTNLFGMTGAWLAGVPARVAARRETVGWRTPLQKFVERRAYQLAHAIVTNAEAVQEHLVEEGVPERKVMTIYNGLCLERVTAKRERNEALALFDLPREGHCRFVTIVANMLHPVKDHPTFLRAAQRVRQAVPEARFVLAGEGKLKEGIIALAQELGLGQDVFFVGRCLHVADLLSVSDVCVLSSKAEGFANSILEYMGAGRPVVATNVGGAREAVVEGKTGYLVEPGDAETMAARIIELLRNPDQARAMGQYGQQIVEQKFSCAAQLTQSEKLYDRLLSRQQAVEMVERTIN